MKQFVTAHEEVAREADGTAVEDQFVEFEVDGRVLRAYQPHEGQLTFMLAALGRGQTQDQRYASIINLMMAALRGDDEDYLQSRLLLPMGHPNRLTLKVIEQIFEYLIEEWFRSDVPSGGATEHPGNGQVG